MKKRYFENRFLTGKYYLVHKELFIELIIMTQTEAKPIRDNHLKTIKMTSSY